MDILHRLLDVLSSFRPTPLRTNSSPLASCQRLDNTETFCPAEVGLRTVYITADPIAAGLAAAEKSNCVFFLGSRSGISLIGEASIVLFPESTDAGALECATLRCLRRELWYQSARDELERVLFRGGSLSNLTARCEDLLELPVAIFDRGSMPLAMGARFRDLDRDAIRNEHREKGYISFRFAQKNSFRQFSDQLERSQGAFTYYYPEASSHPRRVHKITLCGQFAAHCSVVLLREIDEFEDDLIAFLASLVRIDMERTGLNREYSSPDAVLLRALLQDKYKSEKAFWDAARLSGYKFGPWLYVLNFSRQRERGPAADSSLFPFPLLREILANLPTPPQSARYLVEPGRILFLLSTGQPEIVEAHRDALAQFAREGGHLCALSDRFDHILDFHAQADQTELLLQVGEFVGIHAGLLDHRSLFFEKIAYALHNSGIDTSLLSALGALPDNSGSTLLQTAFEYLRQGHSASGAAQALGIHRNTLLRRLERFQESTGLNLDWGEDACKVYAACHLARIMQNAPGSNTE